MLRRQPVNPSHRRFNPEAVGVAHIVVATEAAEDGLTKQSRHRVLAVLAGAPLDKLTASHVPQAGRVVERAVGE